MAQNLLTASVIAVLVISVGVSAKRGCSAFGHSCFGGHGKRSDSSLDSGMALPGRQQLGQQETPPQPYGVLPAGDDIIPIRDGGALDREGSDAREDTKLKLRNILRSWMEYNRRSRQSSDDGYLYETM